MILLLLVLNSEEDRAIVADLFAKNYHRMKRTAMGILCDPTAAEDAVQDTFVRCIKHFDRLKALPEQARSLYLVTAVKNNALNRRRQRGTQATVPLESFDPVDQSAAVEERAIQSLSVAELKEAFKRLPESLKDVLRYKYLLELSDREIADALGVTKSTVRVYLVRARRAVLGMCRENGYAKEND
ncbi:MAG: sigma-70 family RNA polymerase sigma factor [Clostridia bacterium]|jgi:RNA polymerase sigma-70 factor (ECF subfamily)|nr:sigma-70 family RNA polymerase sigma factor [Clostridia bacterium]MBR0437337.1 sigma-70 family RNA polymerase sigma factor [Clostridia bacterium]MBR3037574.1 sigma-70 family RNA polymerase sigma factor [Clostridia bacterium]MBR3130793.1 sigma-70 family RNA polymerase sigma factor [Clostridia bacterium]